MPMLVARGCWQVSAQLALRRNTANNCGASPKLMGKATQQQRTQGTARSRVATARDRPNAAPASLPDPSTPEGQSQGTPGNPRNRDQGLPAAVTKRRGRPRKPQADTPPAPKRRPPAQPRTFPADGLTRCGWAGAYTGAVAEAYIKYHDEEWGRPSHNDRHLFELLVLEGAQAGLSWSTILNKREAYRTAFAGWEPQLVAAFDDSKVELLMQPESGIVKHRGKIVSAINNAKRVLEVQQEFESLSAYIWQFVPDGKPILNQWPSLQQLPTKTAESEALSKALKKRGFSFVGPTTCYSFMQAVGMVNDHIEDCFCWSAMSQ